MPIATVRDKKTGKIVEIRVPRGATNEQIAKFVATQDLSKFKEVAPPSETVSLTQGGNQQIVGDPTSDIPTDLNIAASLAQEQQRQAQKPELGLMDIIKGGGDAALSMFTGATTGLAGQIQGTLTQLAKEIKSGEFGTYEAADRIEKAAMEYGELGTYSPRTEVGQDVTKFAGDVGAALAPLTPLAPAISAQAAKFSFKSPVKESLKNKIDSGSTDPEIATLKTEPTALSRITGGRKIVEDAPAAELVRQGFDPGVIQPIKNQNKATLNALKRMGDIQKKMLDVDQPDKPNGPTGKEFAMKNRPGDVAGDIFMERFKTVLRANRKAGNDINRISNKELKGKQINIAQIGDDFDNALSRIGVTRDNEKLNFKQSSIRGLKALQKPIKDIFKQLLEEGESIDALGLHQLKRQIDNTVSYNKSQKGLSGDAEGVLKSLRASINKQLQDNFPDYKAANKSYAETIDIIDEVQRIAGRQIDLQGPNAEKALGTLMRRLMSNAQSRVPLMDVVDDVNKFSLRLDPTRIGKVPEQVNLNSLILFADELDSNFGAAARTSLQGQFDQSLARNLQSLGEVVSPEINMVGRIGQSIKNKDPVKLKVQQIKAQKEAARAVNRFLNDRIKRTK